MRRRYICIEKSIKHVMISRKRTASNKTTSRMGGDIMKYCFPISDGGNIGVEQKDTNYGLKTTLRIRCIRCGYKQQYHSYREGLLAVIDRAIHFGWRKVGNETFICRKCCEGEPFYITKFLGYKWDDTPLKCDCGSSCFVYEQPALLCISTVVCVWCGGEFRADVFKIENGRLYRGKELTANNLVGRKNI